MNYKKLRNFQRSLAVRFKKHIIKVKQVVDMIKWILRRIMVVPIPIQKARLNHVILQHIRNLPQLHMMIRGLKNNIYFIQEGKPDTELHF